MLPRRLIVLLLLPALLPLASGDPGWQIAQSPTLNGPEGQLPRLFSNHSGAVGATWLGSGGAEIYVAYPGAGNYVYSIGTTANGPYPVLGEVYDATIYGRGTEIVAVAFQTYTMPTYSIVLAVYNTTVGWSRTVLNASTSALSTPRVFAAGGDLVTVWMNRSSGVYSLQSRTRFANGALSPSQDVDLFSNGVFYWDGAVSAAGALFITYSIDVGQVYGRHYAPGSGWTSVVTFAPGSTSGPRVRAAVDAGGNITVLFQQFNATGFRLYASTFNASNTTPTSELLATYPASTEMYTLFLSSFPGGGAHAGWAYSPPSTFPPNISAASRAPGGNWSNATNLYAGPSYPILWALTSNETGHAAIVIIEADGTVQRPSMRLYVPGAGWGPKSPIEHLWALNQVVEQVDAEFRRGGVIAFAWMEVHDGRSDIVVRDYIPDLDPPALLVMRPGQGETFDLPTVTVSGYVEPGTKVWVGSIPVEPAADGSFSTVVALLDGVNTLTVTAEDAFGNRATANVSVLFENPSTDLYRKLEAAEAQLAALDARAAAVDLNITSLRADLAEASANLSAAQADVAAATAALSTAQSDLAALSASLDATGAALNAATGNLTQAEADLAALEASGNASAGEIAAARDNASAARLEVGALAAVQASNMAALQNASANASIAAAALADAGARLNAAAANISDLELSVQALATRVATLESQGGAAAPAAPESALALVAVILAAVAAGLAGLALLRGGRAKKAPPPP